MSKNTGIRKIFGFMRGNIRVIAVTQILRRFFFRMVMSYNSLYILALGGEPAQIGLINSLRPLAGLIVYPLAGYFTDRANRVKLIALAAYASGATYLIYVFAPSWEWLALGALVQGFLVFHFPPTSAIIADSLNPNNRAIGIATMNTLASLLATFSPYIAGLILTKYDTILGMRILYACVAGVSVISATIIIRFLKEPPKSVPPIRSRTSLWGILKDTYSGIPAMLRQLPRTTRALGTLIIFCFIANALTSPFWVVYVVEEIGLSSVEWGFILLVESAIRTLLYIPAGLLVDRYGRSKFVIGGLGLLLASTPLFLISKSLVDVLLIRSAIALVNIFFTPACTALMADTVPREIRGKVMAALGRGSLMIGGTGGGTGGPGMGFLITIPVMIASISGGMIYAMNPNYPWYIMMVAIIASLLVSILFIRDPSDAEI